MLIIFYLLFSGPTIYNYNSIWYIQDFWNCFIPDRWTWIPPEGLQLCRPDRSLETNRTRQDRHLQLNPVVLKIKEKSIEDNLIMKSTWTIKAAFKYLENLSSWCNTETFRFLKIYLDEFLRKCATRVGWPFSSELL